MFILPLVLSLRDLKAQSTADEHQDLLPQFLVSSTLYPTMRLRHLASSLSFVSLALAWTVYTVPYSGGNDDAPTLNAALKSHPEFVTDVTILFKQGTKYNFKTPVRFPKLTNAIVSVQGNISYAADVAATQGTKSHWDCVTRVVDIGSRCSFLLAMVGNPGKSVSHVASSLEFVHALNVYFVQGYGGAWSVPVLSSRNGNFTPTSLRITFAGGNNVTLEGSQDPHSGWVDSHGQSVREKLSRICSRALIKF